MLPLETFSVFFAASVALSLAPGPDNIFVLTQSALFGRSAGLLVTFGLCCGLIVHTLFVAFGVAAIFQSSSFAFHVLSLFGAAYLSYLAWRSLRAGPGIPASQSGDVLTHGQLFLRGLVMNLSNPKVAIFFLAFLPAFTDPDRGSLHVQLILLGAVFILAAALVVRRIAWVSGFLGDYLKRSARAQIIMNRIAGIVFIALALRLLMMQH